MPISNQTMKSIAFDATKQCCWCGCDNTKGTKGYAGERCCPTCGFGGDGEADVPCMFYKLIRTLTMKQEGKNT